MTPRIRKVAPGQTARAAAPTDSLVVTTEWLASDLSDPSVAVIEVTHDAGKRGKPRTALIDTRTDGEYNGTGNRSGMPSAGHLEPTKAGVTP